MNDRQTSSSLTGPWNRQMQSYQVGQMAYHYEVPVADPATQGLVDSTQLDPVSPGAIYHAMLEDGTCEEDDHQEHCACCVYEGHRPEPE